MASVFKKHPGLTLFAINSVLFILLILGVELLLKKCAPYNVATIGHKYCENAKLYGWGYAPHDMIKNFDPDTGKAYISYANNHGWRDLDRDFKNKKNAYRILVLGDSFTFGAVVPADKVFTRVLEDKLLKDGYNAEVINIAYGGWGTDQELEALKNEGVKYGPDLVIYEFTDNDLGDNSYFRFGSSEKKAWKPFYDDIDDHNVLHRHINPYFDLKSHSLKDKIKDLYTHDSEILKRFWAVYLMFRFHSLGTDNGYMVTDNKLIELETVIGLKEGSPLYQSLKSNIAKRLTLQDVNNIIGPAAIPDGDKQVIMRVLEDKLPADNWNKNKYFAAYPDKNSYDWRLLLAIVREMKVTTDGVHADFAVFPTTEEGAYESDSSWYQVSRDNVSRTNYLSFGPVTRAVMGETGIDVIDNTIKYKRARNDGHPNIDGNRAMAEDIWKYLMRTKKEELGKHRL